MRAIPVFLEVKEKQYDERGTADDVWWVATKFRGNVKLSWLPPSKRPDLTSAGRFLIASSKGE